MPEETNKINLSEKKNSAPASKPEEEAAPVKNSAAPALSDPELQLTAESTEPAILKEAIPITQDLPVNEVAGTAKKAPELNEAEATVVKPNKIVEPANEKPADKPAAKTVQAETIKETPAQKTEQTLPAENKAELPQEAKIEQIPKSAPLPPQQIQSKPKQSEQQLKTPAPAPQASQPVQPLSRSASIKTAMPFMVKFKNKLAEFRQIANQKRAEKVQKNLSKITQYAREKQKITNDEVEKLTGVKDAQATNYLNILVKQGKLIRFGKKKNIFYKPINQ